MVLIQQSSSYSSSYGDPSLPSQPVEKDQRRVGEIYLQRRRREVVESDMNESDKRDKLYWLDIYIGEEAEEAANAEEYSKKGDEEKKDEQMRREKQELEQHVEDFLKRANEMQKARSPFFYRETKRG